MTVPHDDRPDYLLAARDVAARYRTRLSDGLTSAEASQRLRTHGRNVIERRERRFLSALARRVFNILTLILLAAAGLSIFLGEVADALIISVVVLIDVALGTLYESYSRYKVDLIRKQVPRIAEVLRDGRGRLIPAEDLVPGDLIVVRQGERIPADARVTRVAGLRVDESVLTGEPGDVSKVPWALSATVGVADQRNMIFAGTIVTTGSGQGLVVATGSKSQIGSLARRVVEAGWQPTPLEHQLRHLGQFIGAGILFVGALLFALGVAQGQAPSEMFRLALTLSVAAIPEDLTLVLTFALAVGAVRLASRRAFVRHLTAAETLGDTTVVAADKTGTLTTGQLTLRRVEGLTGSWGQANFRAAVEHPLARRALFGAVAGTEAGTAEEAPRGSSLERALRDALLSAGVRATAMRKEFPPLATLGFDPRYRYQALLYDDALSPDPLLVVTGAPDILIPRAVSASDGRKSVSLSAEAREQLLERVNAAAAAGTRVLAVSARHLSRTARTIRHEDVNHLTFLVLLFFDDPLRDDAAAAVRGLQHAGVRVLLLTGDHRETATAVARATGILRRATGGVLEGVGIDRLSDQAAVDTLLATGVVARVDPLQKERLISALQQRGENVAMIGDGINDAVALRKADLGVSVANATDVAKDASDLVLLDEGLAVLNDAVWEGRKIRETVRSVLAFLFSTNLTEILAVAATMLAGLPVPFLPAQLLWVNVVTDGTADFALALEPAATRRGAVVPSRKRTLFGLRDLFGMLFASCALLLPTLVAFVGALSARSDLAHARTAAFVTLAAGQLFVAFSYRSLERSLFHLRPWGNLWLLAAEVVSFGLLVAAVHAEPLASLLGTVPLNLREWVLSLALALAGAMLAEARKMIVSHAGRRPRGLTALPAPLARNLPVP